MSADQIADLSDADILDTPQAELPAPGTRFQLLDVGDLFDAAGTIAAAIAADLDAEPFQVARNVIVALDAAGLAMVKRAT